MTSREEIGRAGEALAADFLRRHGLRVVARNVTLPEGEVDLLARDGRRRVAVEVRTITGTSDPLTAFGPDKRRRVARLAQRLAADRVDLVAIRLTPEAAEFRWVRGAA